MKIDFDISKEVPSLAKVIKKTYENDLVIKNLIKGAHDSNWVKEYEYFYSTQPMAKPFVTRLVLENSKHRYFGFVHIRPISESSRVSETYLKPPLYMTPTNKYYLTCKHVFYDYGEEIDCVPYIMPESIFGMCIQASTWIVLKILNRISYDNVKIHEIPEIQKLASGHPFTDKEGLVFKKIARVLRMCECNSFYYHSEDQRLTDEQMINSLYSYVESGLPVIIGINVKEAKYWQELTRIREGYHSIVAIGHTMDKGDINGFIFHDESLLPYVPLSKNELIKCWSIPNSKAREAVVAVPRYVQRPYHTAYKTMHYQLIAFVKKGLIDSDEIKFELIRPKLVPLRQLIYKYLKDLKDELFVDSINDSKLCDFYWTFAFHETKKKRMKEEMDKFYLTDATVLPGDESASDLLYLIRDKKIIYKDLEGNFKMARLDKDGKIHTQKIE